MRRLCELTLHVGLVVHSLSEPASAKLTLIRLLAGVRAQVNLQGAAVHEALLAARARVRPLHGVRAQVHARAAVEAEPLPAHLARVRLHARVSAHVLFQRVQRPEGAAVAAVPARADDALEGARLGVRELVRLHVLALAEGAPADRAGVRPLAGVRAYVLERAELAGEAAVADVAVVRPLVAVYARVYLDVPAAREGGATLGAHVRPPARVRGHVTFELRGAWKELVAQRAREVVGFAARLVTGDPTLPHQLHVGANLIRSGERRGAERARVVAQLELFNWWVFRSWREWLRRNGVDFRSFWFSFEFNRVSAAERVGSWWCCGEVVV